jgi:hypothetical protein
MSKPPGNSSRQHTRDLHEWLREVCRDPGLECADFRIAYVIADHINRKSGEAWPALQTIAAEAALAKNTVIAGIRRLTHAGHLGLVPGRAGSGHSHHYRLLKKVQPVDLLPKQEKVQPTNGKGAASAPEPLIPTGALPARPVRHQFRPRPRVQMLAQLDAESRAANERKRPSITAGSSSSAAA